MKNVASSRFSIKSWDEKPYSEGQDLPKLTRAAVARTFTGEITGEGQVEYLMMYRSDGSARSSVSSASSGASRGKRAASCSNAPGASRTVWRRSPISSSPAPAQGNFGACTAKARRRSGTGLSTPSR